MARTYGGTLHLGGGLLGDLAHEVVGSVASIEGDLVPGGDGLALVVEEHPELQAGILTLKHNHQ